MIVISDTGPLRYLSVTGCSQLLPQLFGRVCCPSAIIRECEHPKAPEALRALVTAKPEWLVIQEPQQAKAHGIAVAGTLNILALAARRGLVDYHAIVTRLRTTTNFRVADAVVCAAYDEMGRIDPNSEVGGT